uniref:Uncharacterized protein n=1 Tax=Arundo donax TaxID=35708 RepID=A0A0A9C2I1_ARUDO
MASRNHKLSQRSFVALFLETAALLRATPKRDQRILMNTRE